MDRETLTVKNNEPISVGKWNGLVKLLLSNRIVKGNRTSPSYDNHGTAVHVDRAFSNWSHAWQTSVNADQALISTGTVNGTEAVVNVQGKKLPLSDPSMPTLLLSSANYDSLGKGWIAVEVTLDDKRELTSVEVIHCASIESEKPSANPKGPVFSQGIIGFTRKDLQVARYPIVRLLDAGLRYVQLSYFNLQYKNNPPPTGPDGKIGTAPGRHFFWPT